jgi:hypothetical protein
MAAPSRRRWLGFAAARRARPVMMVARLPADAVCVWREVTPSRMICARRKIRAKYDRICHGLPQSFG